jgi:excisionase family DNA binding protein
MAQRMIDLDEAAERLQVKPSTVRRLLRAGELPGCQIGRQWRIDPGRLDHFIEERSAVRPKETGR